MQYLVKKTCQQVNRYDTSEYPSWGISFTNVGLQHSCSPQTLSIADRTERLKTIWIPTRWKLSLRKGRFRPIRSIYRISYVLLQIMRILKIASCLIRITWIFIEKSAVRCTVRPGRLISSIGWTLRVLFWLGLVFEFSVPKAILL